jgi:signal transduction histidine kinase
MTWQVSVLVRAQRERIIGRFMDAQRERPDACVPAHPEATVGVLLDELATALEEQGPSSERSTQAREAAERLGHEQFERGCDLAALVREHAMLRDALYAQIREAGVVLTSEDDQTIAAHLLGAIADAAARYGEERDHLLQAQSARHLAFLAHELRNPLSSVGIGFTLLKTKGVLSGDEPCVAAMERGLKSLRRVIDDALVDASLAGGSALQLQELDIAVLIGALVEEAAPHAEHKQVALVVRCDALPCHADHRYMHSALSNLIRNAVKFTGRGTTVRIGARSVEGRLVIEVEDACGGIPDADAERLFDPFVQRGTDRSGFGLGLAIAKQAMDAHNGSIQLRNLPGKGCVFTLVLPQIAARAA